MSLASTSGAGAAGAAGAWARTLLIQVRMNFWKRSLFGGAGARVSAGTGPGAEASGPRAGRLMAGLPRRVRGIVERRVEQRAERRAETMKKRADLPCLPNGLVKPLGESF